MTDRFVQGNLVAAGLDAQSMQHIARWLNLSETTFVLPPTVAGADYRLRIFTPANELPFAGHPTLGSAHAVVTILGGIERGVPPKGRVHNRIRDLRQASGLSQQQLADRLV